MQGESEGKELNPRAAVLLESALEVMDLADGQVELVLLAEGGRIRRWHAKHGPLGRPDLAEFDTNRLQPR